MDYILKKIQKRRDLIENARMNGREDVAKLYQLEFEYACVFLLGYLWNKNVAFLKEDALESIFKKIVRPSMGTIVEICRTLDRNEEFFIKKNKKRSEAQKALDLYPTLRNENFGHGFVFNDKIGVVVDELRSLSINLFKEGGKYPNILAESFDLLLVTEQGHEQGHDRYYGHRFGADGEIYPWQWLKESGDFQLGNVYAVRDLDIYEDYLRLSPFIVITSSDSEEFYLFRDVTEKMIGRVRYNRVLATGTIYLEWADDFAVDIFLDDGTKKKSSNGTILNIYDNNYSQYIDINIGLKRQIRKFLLHNESFVCAKVWGHGGVGKTAMVQKICEELSQEETRRFDYIVFASAKNRVFRPYEGDVIPVEAPIDSYHNLIRCINETIGSSEMDNEDEIEYLEGRRLLLVIDDYETFKHEDQIRISDFINNKLSVNRHKVILTTRTNTFIQGQEFPTDELSKEETIQCLIEVMEKKYSYSTSKTKIDLSDETLQQRVFEVTSGRPLFIFQFAHIWARSGNLSHSVGERLQDKTAAMEFLYGRIFSYLSSEGRILFQAISVLVKRSDLSNLKSKLRYIVNMEADEAQFNQGMEELSGLRIIEIFSDDDDFFRVYSVEILNIMSSKYEKAEEGWRNTIEKRLDQVKSDKKFDLEQGLLMHANEQKESLSEEKKVVDSYREILDRSQSPKTIRLQAILNLADYLYTTLGKKEAAIETFRKYYNDFNDNPSVVRKLATYYWETGYREEAITELRRLLNKEDINWAQMKNIRLELRGICLFYASSVAVDSLDELTLQDQEKKTKENSIEKIRQDFDQIIEKVGKPLFQSVSENDMGLECLSPEIKHHIFTGLYHFSAACIRLDQRDMAYEVCIFGRNNSPSFSEGFKRRLGTIERANSERNLSSSALEAVLQKLQEGQIVSGTVQQLAPYGAFVDLGGVHGLLHKTEMFWGRRRYVTDPSEVVKFGDKITVKVIGFKRTNDRHRISLSLNLYKPGQHLQGTVTQVIPDGCFVETAKGVKGFIHKDSMSWGRSIERGLIDPSDVVNVGDEIEVEVLQFNPIKNYIKYSPNLYKPGQHLQGTVTQVVSGGCFVKIAKGVEGFIDKEIAINNDINVVVSHIDKKDRFIYVRL